MEILLGDTLTMKKNHPCGGDKWLVTRTGADIRMKCLTCGHELLTARYKVEKNIRAIRHIENSSTEISGS